MFIQERSYINALEMIDSAIKRIDNYLKFYFTLEKELHIIINKARLAQMCRMDLCEKSIDVMMLSILNNLQANRSNLICLKAIIETLNDYSCLRCSY
jgi:hypothetical protein